MNFASTPDWVWLALAVALGLYLYRNGWLDNLLQRFNAPAPQTPPLPQQVITFKHVIDQPDTPAPRIHALEPQTEVKAPEPGSQPVLEKLTIKGPVKLHVSEGKIDVSS
ncbi:MAG: hypothetical protein KatS3mg082_2731 [Nitrospiraceae bacterium]|nr:MAG: hypothetical protein KatS3mg082_2731 [Nitrospiraceae bacterium]GIW81334.1 MAG: hypothetical protein KatS3mg105_3141 [Gemmatales bacterium]